MSSSCLTSPSSPHTHRAGTHTPPLRTAPACTHSNSHWSVWSFQRITSPTSGWHARHSPGAIATPACDVQPMPHPPPTPLALFHAPARLLVAVETPPSRPGF